jgi:hypothetical protein
MKPVKVYMQLILEKCQSYGENKDFYAWITETPHIITVFNIIVVDLPSQHMQLCLGGDWTSMSRGIYHE